MLCQYGASISHRPGGAITSKRNQTRHNWPYRLVQFEKRTSNNSPGRTFRIEEKEWPTAEAFAPQCSPRRRVKLYALASELVQKYPTVAGQMFRRRCGRRTRSSSWLGRLRQVNNDLFFSPTLSFRFDRPNLGVLSN